VFVANAHYVFANLRAWGWITLILGALQILATAGVLACNQVARWFAVAVSALLSFSEISAELLTWRFRVGRCWRHGRRSGAGRGRRSAVPGVPGLREVRG
jgi:hypothetical protein